MKKSLRLSSCILALALVALPGPARGEDPELKPLPIDGSPAQAFASHKARAADIARSFARMHPLKIAAVPATENNTVELIAHFQAASEDPNFKTDPQGEASLTLAPKVLLSLNQGHGQMGTSFDEGLLGSRKGDYDMALKGLMVIAYRYRSLLKQAELDFIIDTLVPGHLRGGHNRALDTYPFLTETAPETENHQLMINTTRYLVNQLLLDRTGNATFNNTDNLLKQWLLNYMQTIGKHDFMEFNARPYQRLSLHALYNLHEFARDKEIRDAAQILLDYASVKYAVSSNRQRRINPFRRLKENTNRVDKLNELLWDGHGGDPMTGFFLAYAGPADRENKPTDRFPEGWAFNAVIAGLAPYRPPPAAYILAKQQDIPAYQHRFYHGSRPIIAGTNDRADGGVEIYYRSPSFLMTAGGQFLNSGYGGDEFTKFKETSTAQSTTLLPTRADVKFADLFRFDPYPDDRRALNSAVHMGFACGANLRPAQKKILSESSTHAPQLTLHKNRPFLGWKGSGNENLNAGPVFTTTAEIGMEGIEGLESKATLGDTTEQAPSVASHNDRLFIAWKGAGNDNLNLISSGDDGRTFIGKATYSDTSHHAPALVSHNGRLYMAWTGRGEGNLNIAKVKLFANTSGGFGSDGLEGKVTLGDTSEAAPAVVSHNGRLFIAWKGSGNDNLNLMFSDDDGATFKGKTTFADTSHHAPSLVSHKGRLYLGWTGRGAGNLNVAKVTLIGNTSGAFSIGPLEDKATLGDTSDQGLSLGSHNDRLLLAWKGSGNDDLNLMTVQTARDGRLRPPAGPWHFNDMSRFGLYVAAYRVPPAHPDQLDTHLDSLGFLYAMESSVMSFDAFRAATLERNSALPATLEYGGHYTFNTPDNKSFACWLHPSLEKYVPRVALIGEPNPIGNFTTLPLADGPFIKAPNGHDGLVEIRHPGCETAPITLDYRTASKPVRRDNMDTCPGPWLERAQALTAFAGTLAAAGKPRDEQAALADSAKIYGDLAEIDRNRFGNEFATAMLTALGKIGVDFSVPETDLRQWLNNREFTPYPAFAEALLKLLDGKHLRQPVFIDVIAFNYENTPGVASPRKLADVDFNLLKKAITEGYAVRYGEPVADFQTLVQ